MFAIPSNIYSLRIVPLRLFAGCMPMLEVAKFIVNSTKQRQSTLDICVNFGEALLQLVEQMKPNILMIIFRLVSYAFSLLKNQFPGMTP